MRKVRNWMAALVSCASILTGWSLRAADTETMSKIDMVSLNKVQVIETESAYVLEVEITFQNKNPDAAKLRNGSFRASVETKEKGQTSSIDIGNTLIEELEIPGASNKKTPGTVAKVVTMQLGPKNSESTGKLVRLWNTLGNPSAPMVMLLKGTAELGVKLPKGWVFEQGKSYEVELRFVPTVQRRVLFM